MQCKYKNMKRGYSGYKVRKKDMERINNLKKITLIIGGVVIVICIALSLKKDSKEYTEDMVTQESISFNTSDLTGAGFDSNILLNKTISQGAGFNTDDILNVYYETIAAQSNTDYDNMEIKELFVKYCNIYNVNPSIVYNKASELTKNFTSEDFINNKRVIGTTVCGKERNFLNIEAGILCFVRHMKQIPQDFGMTSSELSFNQDYKNPEFYENEVNNYCDILGGIERELCMAIIYSENARDLSGKQFVNNNNPGCLKNSEGEMAHFENISQGMIEMVLNLKYRYIEDMNLSNCNYDELIDILQLSYAPLSDPDNKDLRINENWTKNVKSIYLELKEDYYSIYNTRIYLRK